jgi:perosamine synthetase
MNMNVPMYQISVSKKSKHLVNQVLESGQLASGPMVHKLEQKLKQVTGAYHVLGVNSGTAALNTALIAGGVGPGDEVIVPAFSFVATANAVLMAGATPIFVDISLSDYCLDPEEVAKAVTLETKAVVAVDLYGQMADYQKLSKICQAHKLLLIADSAQAIGASYRKKPVGYWADICCFSFYATKNVMAGEGGAVVTNRASFAKAADQFRNHGRNKPGGYEHISLGYNYRMSDLHAAVAVGELASLNGNIHKRQANASFYDNNLSRIAQITSPSSKSDYSHVYHQYTIRVHKPKDRGSLIEALESAGVGYGIYYPIVLYRYRHLRPFAPAKPAKQAELAARQVLSLPIWPTLSINQLATVVKVVETWSQKK